MRRLTSRGCAVAIVLLLSVTLGACSRQTVRVPAATDVVFLVRHAEKTGAADDPGLTSAGARRAMTLAALLRNAGIRHVHSTDYRRTRDTAAPVAGRLGLETRIYDAGDLPALVEHVLREGGRHLVVGHSNTTPEVVRLLGGDPGTPIDESSEYDRLYVVTIGTERVNTLLLRYGNPYTPP